MIKKSTKRLINTIRKQMFTDALAWSRQALPKVCAIIALVSFIAATTVGAIFLVVYINGYGFTAFVAGIVTGSLQVGIVIWVWSTYDKVRNKAKLKHTDLLNTLAKKKTNDETN